MTEQLLSITDKVFRALLQVNGVNDGYFRIMMTASVSGVQKPVLLIGRADGKVEDGQCITILNPDPDLLDEIQAGVAYTGDSLKKIVSGRCDAMIHTWIDAYKNEPIQAMTAYSAKMLSEPKFVIK